MNKQSITVTQDHVITTKHDATFSFRKEDLMDAEYLRHNTDHVLEYMLEFNFPNIANDDYKVLGPGNRFFNCLTFAIGQKEIMRQSGPHSWTPTAMLAYLKSKGYRLCDDGEYEPEYDKVAVYVDWSGMVRHLARRVEDGWQSKLGAGHIIFHRTTEQLEKPFGYGVVKYYLKCPANHCR